MRGDAQRVLFVSHAADRSGPTRFLVSLLRWVRESSDLDLDVEVAVMRGGELEPDLRALATTWELEGPVGVPVEGREARRARRPLRRRWKDLGGYGVTYLNGAWTGRALGYLPRPEGRVLAHIHELDLGFGRILPEPDRQRLLREADRLVVGCAPVQEMLVARFGVSAEKVTTVPYWLGEEPAPDTGGGARIRSQLGIPDGAGVVGTVAVTDWRKAPDLLLEIGWHLRRMPGAPPVHLIWVGGPNKGSPDLTPTSEEVEAMGLTGRFHAVGHQPALWDWYRSFDVFALPSREDAFPLACLEAAAVGVPTVAFDAGGMAGFVADGSADPAGRIVPYPRTDRFAAALAELLADGALRAQLGAAAAARVRAEHSIERCAPPLVEEILRLQRSGRR